MTLSKSLNLVALCSSQLPHRTNNWKSKWLNTCKALGIKASCGVLSRVGRPSFTPLLLHLLSACTQDSLFPCELPVHFLTLGHSCLLLQTKVCQAWHCSTTQSVLLPSPRRLIQTCFSLQASDLIPSFFRVKIMPLNRTPPACFHAPNSVYSQPYTLTPYGLPARVETVLSLCHLWLALSHGGAYLRGCAVHALHKGT